MMETILYSQSQLKNLSFINSLKQAKQIQITSRLNSDGQRMLASKIKELFQLEKLDLTIYEYSTESIRYQLLKSIENLENLKELSLEMRYFKTEDARNLGKLFKKLHQLESFQIVNFNNWNIEQQGIIGLQKGFQQLKNLKKFSISVNQNNQINFQNISEMTYSLNALTHLDVYTTSKFGEKQESLALQSLISKQINLTHLHLNFQNENQQFDENLVSIVGDSLKNLFELTNLTLIFKINKKISQQQLVNFKNCLLKINNLIEFIFEFSNQYYLDSCNPLVILDGLQMHKKLKRIDFFSFIINYDHFFRISQVEQLYLDLKFHQLSMEQARNLCYGLRSFENLTILKFIFDKGSNVCISEIVREFGKALKRMKNLIKLELIFIEDCEIGLGATQKIARGISMLKNLQNLSLEFSDNNIIGEEGAKSIGESLKQLNNLNEFKIIIGQDNKIYSQGIQGFSQGVQCLQNLKTLSIKIKNRNQLEYYDIKYFGECVQNLKNLIDLELELPIKIYKDQSIEDFSNSLTTLQNLKCLSLTFLESVKQDSISQMLKTINFLNSLQNIKFQFNQIDEDHQLGVIESLFQSISHVKSLVSVDLNFDELSFLQKPKNLAKCIQNLINLKYLSFHVSYIETNSLEDLINIFQRKLTRLVQFKQNIKLDQEEYDSDSSDNQIDEESFIVDEDLSIGDEDFNIGDEDFNIVDDDPIIIDEEESQSNQEEDFIH